MNGSTTPRPSWSTSIQATRRVGWILTLRNAAHFASAWRLWQRVTFGRASKFRSASSSIPLRSKYGPPPSTLHLFDFRLRARSFHAARSLKHSVRVLNQPAVNRSQSQRRRSRLAVGSAVKHWPCSCVSILQRSTCQATIPRTSRTLSPAHCGRRCLTVPNA